MVIHYLQIDYNYLNLNASLMNYHRNYHYYYDEFVMRFISKYPTSDKIGYHDYYYLRYADIIYWYHLNWCHL